MFYLHITQNAKTMYIICTRTKYVNSVFSVSYAFFCIICIVCIISVFLYFLLCVAYLCCPIKKILRASASQERPCAKELSYPVRIRSTGKCGTQSFTFFKHIIVRCIVCHHTVAGKLCSCGFAPVLPVSHPLTVSPAI